MRPEPTNRWLGLGSVAWLQGFNLLRFGAGLLMAIGLSRAVGNPALLAPFETLWLLHTLLSATLNASTLNHFLAAYRRASAARADDVFTTCARLAMSTGLVCGVVGFVGGWLLLGPGYEVHIITTALFSALSQATSLAEYKLWAEGRFRAMALWGVLGCGAQVGVLISFPLGYGLIGVFIAVSIWAGLRTLAYAFTFGLRGFGFGHTAHNLGAVQVRNWWPLLGVAILAGSAGHIDGFLVRYFCPADDFVLFRYASRELPITLILANGLSAALSARVALERVPRQSLWEIRTRSLRLMHICFPLSAGLLLAAEPLFAWVYGSQFASASAVFSLLLLLVIPRMLFPQSILLGLQANRPQLIISGLEWLLHIGLALVLIPLIGIAGAAWATLSAYLLEKILLAMWLWQNKRIAPGLYIPLLWWGAYSIGLAILWAIW